MGNDQTKGQNFGGSNKNTNNNSNGINNAKHVKYNFLPQKFQKNSNNSNKTTSSEEKGNEAKPLKPVKLLVIDAHSDENWYEMFKNCKLLNGRKIVIEQTGWRDFSLTYYSESNNAICNLRVPRKPIPNTPQRQFRTFIPDYCLVRNLCRSIGQFHTSADRRSLLFGLMLSNIESINSFESIYYMLDRPLMNGELIKLNKRYGQSQFPIIDIIYYPMPDEMLITPQYPVVVKIGHGHAGFGKMKLETHKQFGDIKSIVACTDMYCTAEQYIEGQCDLRIQKIGNNYQAFRRESVSGNWKTNTGTSYIEEIELLPRYKFWADECSMCFGGLDICTVDVLVSKKDGKEYILEFNGTASGFGDKDRDNKVLKEYVLSKMNKYFCPELCDIDENMNENIEEKVGVSIGNESKQDIADTVVTQVVSETDVKDGKDTGTTEVVAAESTAQVTETANVTTEVDAAVGSVENETQEVDAVGDDKVNEEEIDKV